MRILINMWPRFVLSHVGDYSANLELLAMSQQFPDMEFLLVQSIRAKVIGNALALFLKAIQKSRLVDFRRPLFRPLHYLRLVNYLPQDYLCRVQPDVIFAHALYPWPSLQRTIPMVAFEYFASEQYMRKAGILDLLPLDINVKRWCTGHAQLILTYTPTSKALIEKYMPEAKGRIWQVPVYMPHVEPMTENQVVKKHSEHGKIRVLFVGGAARRKGLPQLLKAFRRLDNSIRERAHLTVVSNFRDGPVPDIDPGIEVLSNVGATRMMQILQDAHIFAFPTQYDTYGRVIIEAMANGCGIVCSNADPQDWILDYGQCGVGVDPTSPDQIAAALAKLVKDKAIRTKYANAALKRFSETFYHRVVAVQYRQAFETAITSWRNRARNLT